MFKRHAFTLGALLGVSAAIAFQVAPAIAQQPSIPTTRTSGDDSIVVEDCMVRFINKTKVPAETQGKLTELLVEEGMSIKKGDVIAIVDDKQAQLQLELRQAEELVAKLNAQNDVNKRDAVSSEEIARAEAETYKELHEKGATPYWEWRKKEAEAKRALLRIELADLNEDTAIAEYLAKKVGTQLANSDIEMRTIRAEFDAYIENRFAQLGEWVQPGSPIVELVQMDVVRVEGFIDINYVGQVQQGAEVSVHITIGGSRAQPVTRTFVGKVDYVSMEQDLNRRYRIWVKIPNERGGDDWLIKPGMRATMQIATSATTGTL